MSNTEKEKAETEQSTTETCDVEGCSSRSVANLHRVQNGERCEYCLLYDLDARKL